MGESWGVDVSRIGSRTITRASVERRVEMIGSLSRFPTIKPQPMPAGWIKNTIIKTHC